MADVIRKATNRFTKGLIMDFSPENTKNEVLTNALNATLLTFNGNELSLQNDMGNGRVETAYLPEGYIPVGTCEYGGIIYIVSYNPLEDKSQIGCFPSPERNISSDEIGIPEQSILRSSFQKIVKDKTLNYEYPDPSGEILNNHSYVLLRNDNLNPGDKFIICSNKEIYDEQLADLWCRTQEGLLIKEGYIANPIIALNVVSIEDSGKIIYLNNDLKQYSSVNQYTVDGKQYTDTYSYHIVGKMANGANVLAKDDIDSYRNILSSGYSVFKAKTSGKLAILAELIMIDSYSVTHYLQPKKDSLGGIIEGAFDVVIHTEITPEINANNFSLVPKLQYYFLEKSQGYLQCMDSSYNTITQELYKYDEYAKNEESAWQVNSDFLRTSLEYIYEPITVDIKGRLGDSGKFNFPIPKTYHGRLALKTSNSQQDGTTKTQQYTKFTEGKLHKIDLDQVQSNYAYYKNEVQATFYYYKPSGAEEGYMEYMGSTPDPGLKYYAQVVTYEFIDAARDTEHQTKELYISKDIPALAGPNQIADATIMKYQKQNIISYVEATAEDLLTEDKLFYKEGNVYIQLVGSPDYDKQYYKQIIEEGLVAIGKVLPADTVPGDIYYKPQQATPDLATQEEIDKYYDFVTYPLKGPEEAYGSPLILYIMETKTTYVELTQEQINNHKELGITLYYKSDYVPIPNIGSYTYEGYQIFIRVPIDTFVSSEQFEADESKNYIYGVNQPDPSLPDDDPLYIYVLSDFIPMEKPINSSLIVEGETYYGYKDFILGNITIPKVVVNNGLDLPFKYDYTLVPCMNYGKLQHLAVSNTVDFSKLHAFNQSNFTTWKYRIDNNQLRLTFGVDVYDTYEDYKVDGLILEFYDHRGFAGSLELLDKKSYSGEFTKIIPLNSLKALSRNKITDDGTPGIYRHNVNISDSGELAGVNYTLTWLNDREGWNLPSEDEFNDCGTLYSNILYGVKTYLRRTTANGISYIPKKKFFLYTLPIYNDYYYELDDFSNLTYPELEFALTYKLKDSSIKDAYNSDSISNGFNTVDKSNVDSYLGGFYDTSISKSFDVVKYYKYTGTTDLYLEVGLKEQYQSFNLSYNHYINQYYKCYLQLYSNEDSDKEFTINAGTEGLIGANQILNYNNIIDESVNKISFITNNGNTSKTYEATQGIYDTNFISHEGTSPIKIQYEFVVGYNVNVADIRSTQVQATTVCALFHKKPTEEYNYEDFGVYEQLEGETTNLLSNIMFYNEGTAEKEVFGICRQISTNDALPMGDQCSSIAPIETDAQPIKLPGKLNSGEPLRQLVGNIGKLTFCQPHAHGLSTLNGVNIHEGTGVYVYGIPPNVGGWDAGDSDDDTMGTAPRSFLYNHPRYNLSLNTKNAINYNSEFISTLEWKEISSSVWGVNIDDAADAESGSWNGPYQMRSYQGFKSSEIATFNRKMIETMKYVYAYNPDYDSLSVNKGNITLQNYNPSFTSNIINEKSQLQLPEGKTLNDFIYLGPILFSTYLQSLKQYSTTDGGSFIEVETVENGKKIPLPQLQFKENFDYCGTENNKYLISSLTYNTPVPREIESELEFSASNITVVKHTDGSSSFLKGTPNKKALYGFNSDLNKMMQLDVSNYIINENGSLQLLNYGILNSYSGSLTVDSTNAQEIHAGLLRNSYNYTFTPQNTEDVSFNLSISLQIDMAQKLKEGDSGFFLGANYQNNHNGYSFRIVPVVKITNTNTLTDSSYELKLTNISFTAEGVALNDKVSLYGEPIALSAQDPAVIKQLLNGAGGYINMVNTYGQSVSVNVSECYAGQGGNGGMASVSLSQSDATGAINVKFMPNVDLNNSQTIVALMSFKLNSLSFTINQVSKLDKVAESFVSVARTINYATRGTEYKVLDVYNNTRLRGTSITLNDLLYEPSVDGHRLFMRNNLCSYNSTYRGKLYYRSLDLNDRGTWDARRTDKLNYLNSIYFYTGPCYTTDNL